MKRKNTNIGKRIGIGIKYPKAMMIRVTEEMREYVKRKGFASGEISGNEYVRRSVFVPGWEQELAELREEQKNL